MQAQRARWYQVLEMIATVETERDALLTIPASTHLNAGKKHLVPRTCRHPKGRPRRIAIVAMARKLLAALWRYLETGLVPTGAVLKA
jgi:hypothetical protein